jgi:hypothetical protein
MTKFSQLFHCHHNIRSQKYHCIHSLATVRDVYIYWGKVFYLQRNLETRGTEDQGATHSRAKDVPLADEGGATENKGLNDGGRSN